MYLCNCNGLTVTQIVRACSNGVTNATEVFSSFGAEQCCGKCVPEIQECLASAKEQNAFQDLVIKGPNIENNNTI